MPNSATAGGFLLVLAIVLPVAGVLLSVALGGRQAERIALIMMPAGLAVAVALVSCWFGCRVAPLPSTWHELQLPFPLNSWYPAISSAVIV